jgi:hypothetical protein
LLKSKEAIFAELGGICLLSRETIFADFAIFAEQGGSFCRLGRLFLHIREAILAEYAIFED